ncbi:MAG TPA: hypothetical protein DEF12_15950 [Rhodobacteraceae bacterium]|nr:hypothetical protein [Paracoccaceae bacterium]
MVKANAFAVGWIWEAVCGGWGEGAAKLWGRKRLNRPTNMRHVFGVQGPISGGMWGVCVKRRDGDAGE